MEPRLKTSMHLSRRLLQICGVSVNVWRIHWQAYIMAPCVFLRHAVVRLPMIDRHPINLGAWRAGGPSKLRPLVV